MKKLKLIILLLVLIITNTIIFSYYIFKIKENNILMKENISNEMNYKTNQIFSALDYTWLEIDSFQFSNCKSSKILLEIKINNNNNIKKSEKYLELLKNCQEFKEDEIFINEVEKEDLKIYKEENYFIDKYLKYYYFMDENKIKNIVKKYNFKNKIFITLEDRNE